jgi:predicted DNA-binding transcriptional regulator AlpA
MMPNMRMLSYPDLVELGVPYSRPYLSKLVREQKFPAPFSLSAYRIVWRETDVHAWIEQRAAAAEPVVHKVKPVVRGRHPLKDRALATPQRNQEPHQQAPCLRRALPPLVE